MTGRGLRDKTAGVFVAGDCRKARRQITTAIADGTAALAACRYLDE